MTQQRAIKRAIKHGIDNKIALRVAIYLRVSTEEQGQQQISIPAQRSRCVAYCEARDWSIYDFYIDEGHSGKTLDRPDMQRLMKDAALKKFDLVLVWKLDRLSRRQQHMMYLIEDVFCCGPDEALRKVDLASVTENIDTTTTMGRAMIGIIAVFAQLERETIVERTIMAREEAAKQGRFLGGPALYGYEYDPAKKLLMINPLEAETVRYIYDEYLKGDRGYTVIADALNARKVPGPEVSWWYSMAVSRVLKNATYAGLVEHKGKLFKGKHEGIVTRDEWERVQRIMGRNNRFAPNGHNQGLLSGIIYCGECGARVRFKPTGMYKGRPRLSYVCYSVDKGSRHLIKDPYCPSHHFKAEKIEKRVEEELMMISHNPDLFRQALQDRLDRTTEGEDTEAAVAQAQKELEDVKRRIKKWQDAFEIDDDFSLADLRERTNELRERRLYLEEKIQAYQEAQTAKKEAAATGDALEEIMAEFPRVWDNEDFDGRRRMLLGIVDKVFLYKDGSVKFEWV